VHWEDWRTKHVLPALVRPRAVGLAHEFFIFSADSQAVLKFRNGVVEQVAALSAPAAEYVAAAVGDSVVVFTGAAFEQLRPNGAIADLAIAEQIAERRGATMSVYGRDVVLFGGKAGSARTKQYFNDVVVLNMRTKRLVVHQLEPAPPPRWRHSATAFGNQVYVYGGSNGAQNHIPLNDVWVLDLSRLQWRQVPVELAPRRRHAAIPVAKLIAVVGGTIPNQTAPLVLFNPKTAVVSTVAEFGNVPTGAACDAAVSADGICVFVGANKKGKHITGLYRPVLPEALSPSAPSWDDNQGVSDAPVIRKRRSVALAKAMRQSTIVRGQVVFQDEQFDDDDDVEDVDSVGLSSDGGIFLQTIGSAAGNGYGGGVGGIMPPSEVNLRPKSHLIVTVGFVVIVVVVMMFVATTLK
jgi:hypothetical protein